MDLKGIDAFGAQSVNKVKGSGYVLNLQIEPNAAANRIVRDTRHDTEPDREQ